jgi:hypothetical protein
MSSVLEIAGSCILCFTNIFTYIKLTLHFCLCGHVFRFREAKGYRLKHDKKESSGYVAYLWTSSIKKTGPFPWR